MATWAFLANATGFMHGTASMLEQSMSKHDYYSFKTNMYFWSNIYLPIRSFNSRLELYITYLGLFTTPSIFASERSLNIDSH